MFKRLLFAVAFGATILACTPAPGGAPAATGTPDVVTPTDAPSDAAPSDAAPSDAAPMESASPAAS